MTQYDAKLYRKMATTSFNEIFIKNKYPNDYIVYFQKVTELDWQDLEPIPVGVIVEASLGPDSAQKPERTRST
ncbi:hypothetical protein FHA84_09270 [Salmonella enterica subsp. enterica]|uniref:Uncharacterized protein n=1 Tax=Salmonella enterica subsp. enterica serovar Colindale TaxID=1967991 RepID=A0A5W8C8U6_SALET|nr:hypothetical protein [Salmonella enterica]EAW1405226.1 hypothetical protein [Salmonella enterica subsp. enterica]EBF8618754.1 hypothetical protein [Salmonella enterica subsp. enterica serovar Istanbul]ECO6315112.1 hypothetical protein [Salmonella enterica subsp. enterica serovar Enteritidis]EIO0860526.1 hypothetical protein [Salmonella enterica subsp. enterica serovar Virchow]EAA8645971.1 hypothetical protein [Salmonella enterica]